jgi:hypothetical protein
MRANETLDSIDTADLTDVTGGRFFGFGSQPQPLTKPAPPYGSPNDLMPFGKGVTGKQIREYDARLNAWQAQQNLLKPLGHP